MDWGTIQRFLDGTRPNIRIDTVDKLCEHLGLELRPKRKPTKKIEAIEVTGAPRRLQV